MRYFMQRGVMVAGVLAFVIICGVVLPGCIVGEIRDDLKSANARLGTVDQNLAATTAKLDVVDRSLAETNSKLSLANDRLNGVGSALDTTNTSLKTLDERVRLLASIDKSMTNLDVHLASLRTTIGRIDSTIPFLDLGGDPPVEQPAQASVEAAPAGTAGAMLEAGSTEVGSPEVSNSVPSSAVGSSIVKSQGEQASSRDAWLGPWVSADLRRTWTLVLLADGRYVREYSTQLAGANGQMEQIRGEKGMWKREGAGPTLELVLMPAAAGTTQETNSPSRWRVLHQSVRTLSLEDGLGGVWVLRKP